MSQNFSPGSLKNYKSQCRFHFALVSRKFGVKTQCSAAVRAAGASCFLLLILTGVLCSVLQFTLNKVLRGEEFQIVNNQWVVYVRNDCKHPSLLFSPYAGGLTHWEKHSASRCPLCLNQYSHRFWNLPNFLFLFIILWNGTMPAKQCLEA